MSACRYDIGFSWLVEFSSVLMDVKGVSSTSVVVDEGEVSTIGVEEDDDCSSFRTIGIDVSSLDVVSCDDTTDDEVISDEVDGLEMDVDEIE
mmetsp:Transcript_5455/g.7887  ORF Transcript_5455/g.7887 Transcript_5455/m.7887 type:complete len:92 (-) Transcript_5455:2196-2471(-)